MTSRKRPDGLGSAGGELWRSIRSVYELAPHEEELLRQAARAVDLLDRINTELASSPLVVEGSTGQLRPHPLLGTVAMHRQSLEHLLRALALPVGDEEFGRIRSPQQREAAQARWRQRGQAKG